MRRTLLPLRSEPPSILMPTSSVAAETERRLLVVVCGVNGTAFVARRIHEIASGHGANVLLVGAVVEDASEAELRREIAMLAAFLRDAGSQVETRIEQGWEWLDGIRFMLSDSDLAACCAAGDGHAARAGLPDGLSLRLRRPVYMIEGPMGGEAYRPGLLRAAGPWIGSLAVILGFLWLQIRLSQGSAGIPTKALLVLSLPIEIGLIWVCNAAVG
jgi:hypothetical protein